MLSEFRTDWSNIAEDITNSQQTNFPIVLIYCFDLLIYCFVLFPIV